MNEQEKIFLLTSGQSICTNIHIFFMNDYKEKLFMPGIVLTFLSSMYFTEGRMDLLREAVGPIAFPGGSVSEFLRKPQIATCDFYWGSDPLSLPSGSANGFIHMMILDFVYSVEFLLDVCGMDSSVENFRLLFSKSITWNRFSGPTDYRQPFRLFDLAPRLQNLSSFSNSK